MRVLLLLLLPLVWRLRGDAACYEMMLTRGTDGRIGNKTRESHFCATLRRRYGAKPSGIGSLHSRTHSQPGWNNLKPKCGKISFPAPARCGLACVGIPNPSHEDDDEKPISEALVCTVHTHTTNEREEKANALIRKRPARTPTHTTL